ncbi:cupin domain-containing protein [Dinghuibacter silviterrae]|uniref:Cupin domain n=1 Tax=Dinghuibacter silviterrae TaxID=1539049 RepID=A0A4R8DG44_9BACT|nr:cupin domain-containing protein [Dinghuibacter silviterrae]TDW96589.1 cupin domain [Dinghuibacter silviterrae]
MKINGLVKGFVEDESLPWESVGDGVQRKILAYDDRLMVVRVRFESGGIGPLHHHPHSQITYVESGVFEIEMDGVKRVLKGGDAYYVASGLVHGAVCLEQGVLVDAFSPTREDFLL